MALATDNRQQPITVWIPHSPGSDPSDNGAPANCITAKLTIGDPSSSYSERWEMQFTNDDTGVTRRNCNLDYGTPFSAEYGFVKGRSYTFKLQWTDTNRSAQDGPDFDWQCLINDSDTTGIIQGLYGTGPFIVEDPDELLTQLFNGDDIDYAEGRVGKIIVPGIRLKTAYSDQLLGRTANPLPYVHPNPQFTMYMGARNDNKGYLQVEASILPTEDAAHALIGIRRMGTTTILASAPLQNGGKTPVSFNNAGNFQRYEVVAGLDANADGILQNSEVTAVMPKQFVLVTQSDYDNADWALWGLGGLGGMFTDVAADLLEAFRTGAIPPGATSARRTLDSTALTHPVGAIWNFSNTARVAHYTFPQSSGVAQAVANATPVKNAIRSRLGTVTQRAEILVYFMQNPTVMEHTFGPWEIPPTGVVFGGANPDLLFAFHGVNISGQMLVTVRRSDRQVTSITYEGSFTDLYDFDYNAAIPAPTAARVQTGFPTLGNYGNVFFTTVQFQLQDNSFNFQFQL